MNLSADEARAVLTLCLMASFADGDKHEREREEIKRVAQNFAQHDVLHLSALYQDVLMQRVALPDVALRLKSTAAKQLAYEMAVCVCDADGALSGAEKHFLAEMRVALGLDAAVAVAFMQQAETIAAGPMTFGPGVGAGVGVAVGAVVGDVDGVHITTAVAQSVAVNKAELDSTIVNAAIVNGALELLPEALSTMAIIPLQMKLVWRIGKAYGFELDSGHVKDFLATVGVGLTSQYLEQAGRTLLGGLLGKVGGGLLRGAGQQAVSTGMSFATTYALGQVAKRYYAGGRMLSTQILKEAYAGTVQDAQGLRTRYLPDMQAKARTLDARSVLAMVRGA